MTVKATVYRKLLDCLHQLLRTSVDLKLNKQQLLSRFKQVFVLGTMVVQTLYCGVSALVTEPVFT